MDVLEAIRGRRSVRKFLPEPVAEADIETILDAGIWAPSGGNAQTWRLVACTEPELLGKIMLVSPGILGSPPVVIAICQDLEKAGRKGGRGGVETLVKMDSAICGQNMLLAAHSLGLGSCMILSFHPESVRRLLNLPEHIVPQLLISVGVPAVAPPPPPRKLDGVFHRERYSAAEDHHDD